MRLQNWGRCRQVVLISDCFWHYFFRQSPLLLKWKIMPPVRFVWPITRAASGMARSDKQASAQDFGSGLGFSLQVNHSYKSLLNEFYNCFVSLIPMCNLFFFYDFFWNQFLSSAFIFLHSMHKSAVIFYKFASPKW